MLYSNLSIILLFLYISFDLTSCGYFNTNYSWRTHVNTLLTVDLREQGTVRLTKSEEAIVDESTDSDSLETLNGSQLIELVVTNSDGEEVTLFVSESVYNTMYGKVKIRKNPRTFGIESKISIHNEDRSEDLSIDSTENETVTNFTNKNHTYEQATTTLPIFKVPGYKSVRVLNKTSEYDILLLKTPSHECNVESLNYSDVHSLIIHSSGPCMKNVSNESLSVQVQDNNSSYSDS